MSQLISQGGVGFIDCLDRRARCNAAQV